jgi:hypothetical protein
VSADCNPWDQDSWEICGRLTLQVICNRRKLLQCRCQFLGYLQSEHFRIRKVGAVFERFVPKPENIKIYLVPFEQLIVAEALETLVFDAFMAVLGVEALDELVHIRTDHWENEAISYGSVPIVAERIQLNNSERIELDRSIHIPTSCF